MTDAGCPGKAGPEGSDVAMTVDLAGTVYRVRANPGLRAKSALRVVGEVLGGSDWLSGPGDDGAVVETAGVQLVTGGEVILPAFVAHDPYGAGIAAVLTNVNDLAAMGAWPLAVVDALAGPEPLVREALAGMRWAAECYDVPIVGGHLTVTSDTPSLAAFGLGRTERPLSARSVRPGQTLAVACCLDGKMRTDFPFFPSFDERGDRLAGDVRLLAELAARDWVSAAKDVSMAGLVGSLGMLLECNGFGVTVDLTAVPVPPSVPMPAWLTCFPCYAFLLCVPAERYRCCADAFADRGLACAAVGQIDDSGLIRLAAGDSAVTAFDLTREAVTNLRVDAPAGSGATR